MIAKGKPKLTAFLLHRATGRLYHTLFLVCTLYSPKTRNLNRSRSQTEALEARLREVWPGFTKFERCYELLRAAYVKARYSPHYRIAAEELAWIGSPLEVLRGLVEELCLKRLDALKAAA